ncbi:MAG: hypothetical protein ABI851_13865 [Saprospiraceae bacterium]
MDLDHSIKNGTISGTLLSIAGAMTSGDVFKTIVLASIGAIVSFVISGVLRWLIKKVR